MNKTNPRTLPGFMELLPEEQILFNQIQDKIRKTYERFGFLPLDTPIIESSEVLLAKAGGETEKQIYRFLKGDTDLSLRFDLTVPLAKYVAQNYNNLSFPFRRYQIGKVYRGERQQKGRFREFYQCDIDIIGDEKLSIINDAELPSVIYSIFNDLGFGDFTICINNRKILNGLFESLNQVNFNFINKTDDLNVIKFEGFEFNEEDLTCFNVINDNVKLIFDESGLKLEIIQPVIPTEPDVPTNNENNLVKIIVIVSSILIGLGVVVFIIFMIKIKIVKDKKLKSKRKNVRY